MVGPGPLIFSECSLILFVAIEAAYVAVLCCLAVLGWRKRRISLAIAFCVLLLGSAICDWAGAETFTRQMDRAFSHMQIMPAR
jgi:glucan phosphoethanolaminetransferase (alkaline phosphatase superfamily)